MSIIDITYFILIAILSLSIAIFQYIHSVKKKTNLSYIFLSLRFLSLFLLGILLLNPKFKQKETQLIKPNLAVVVDNSNSIEKLGQTNK